MLTQNYTIAFYISFRMERKQNPIAKKLDGKIERFVEKTLDAELIRPVLSKKMNPDIGNPVLREFKSILDNFEHEDDCIKVSMRHPDGVENFEIEHRGNSVIAQYKLTFNIFNKDPETSASNFGHVLPLLLKKIMKIRIETKEIILSVTDYRTSGQIKLNEKNWPANADTVF